MDLAGRGTLRGSPGSMSDRKRHTSTQDHSPSPHSPRNPATHLGARPATRGRTVCGRTCGSCPALGRCPIRGSGVRSARRHSRRVIAVGVDGSLPSQQDRTSVGRLTGRADPSWGARARRKIGRRDVFFGPGTAWSPPATARSRQTSPSSHALRPPAPTMQCSDCISHPFLQRRSREPGLKERRQDGTREAMRRGGCRTYRQTGTHGLRNGTDPTATARSAPWPA